MGKLGKDAKDLLIGNDGSDKEATDFKTELQTAIKVGTVTKSDGTLLITSRMNADKLGETIVKKQEDGVRKIKDGEVYDSPEEEKEAIRKKEEKERKRREKEAELAKISQDKQKSSKETKVKLEEEKMPEIGEKQ